MRILVTGGAGYVGVSVIHELLQYPEVQEMVVYDNFLRRNYGLLLGDKPPSAHKLTVVVDDILNSRRLAKVAAEVDCIIHLAALAPSPFSDEYPHAFDQTNHWGTAEICHAVEEFHVDRLVYVSSGAVYGYGSTAFTVEDDPLPVTAYGNSKLAGERHVSRVSDFAEAIILRSATVYGITRSARFDTFVNRFALDTALGRQLQIQGSGEQIRPIVHVESLARVIARTALGELQSGTYNVVDDNVSVSDVASVFHKLRGVDTIYISQGQRLRDLLMATNLPVQHLLGGPSNLEQQIERMLAKIAIA